MFAAITLPANNSDINKENKSVGSVFFMVIFLTQLILIKHDLDSINYISISFICCVRLLADTEQENSYKNCR
ncbi:hypothetical protein A9Q98_07905 [Thalassotalea sp. 42_200_T64]|nr:hypothetical protein A9Q98_07905 [Thalassotalea sp. 42_200_T64]